MAEVFELQVISGDGGNGAMCFKGDGGVTGNGEDVPNSRAEASEGDVLLQTPTNGGRTGQPSTAQESLACRIRRELKEEVFPKVQLWMIIVFTLFLIIIIILIGLAVCAAIHEDEDEKFDSSLFKVPLYHSGRFRLPNQVFTEDLTNLSSTKSQVLATNLQEKIAGLYTFSPALGRYFSEALINVFRNGRNGSVIADYQLKFLMPEEEEEEGGGEGEDHLRNFMLSREMVFNVFRQFVYDQEADRAQPLYIAPDSLQTF